MADFYTRFSCLLDVRTPANAARALDLYQNFMSEGSHEDPPSEGFLLSIQPEHGGTQLLINDDGTGDPQAVIEFVRICAVEFDLVGRWGFQFANTCSTVRPDAFGGGAHALDLATGETIAWTSSGKWLADVMAGSGAP